MHPCQADEVQCFLVSRAPKSVDPEDLESIVEDVREKRSFAFRSEDTVVVLALKPLHGRLDLFVQLAVSSLSDGAVSTYLPFVEKVARDLKATKVRFRSRRRGWTKALDARWRLSHVEYELDVSDGS